jgi:hypothetical protein
MAAHYGGRKAAFWYGCGRGTADYAEPLCQSLSGQVLDDLVASQILAAVEPAALEASLAAVAEVERERAALMQHWQLRLERAGYEAERAARQYQACEPDYPQPPIMHSPEPAGRRNARFEHRQTDREAVPARSFYGERR